MQKFCYKAAVFFFNSEPLFRFIPPSPSPAVYHKINTTQSLKIEFEIIFENKIYLYILLRETRMLFSSFLG